MFLVKQGSVRRWAAFVVLTILVVPPLKFSRHPSGQNHSPQTKGIPVGGRAITPEMVREMVAGLKRSPGCLGADVGQTQSGKFLIFGWFDSKKAALAWHAGAEHQKMIETFAPDYGPGGVAMADLPDDVGPILVVASASPPKPGGDGQPARGFQLAIEIHAPLPGGVRFGGGGFAPDGFREAISRQRDQK
jgi:quinol monooxygenase YgiN